MSTRYLFWDLITNSPKAELPLGGVQYGELLNDAGGFMGNISARHDLVDNDILDPGTTAIYVDRNGSIVWGGILWRVNATSGTEKNTLQLAGNTFWSLFTETDSRGRYIQNTKAYNAVDQLAIVRDLVNYAQDTGIHGASAAYGIATGSELTTDNGGVQQLRTITYNVWDHQNIGKIIADLSALQNGFEFLISCAYSGGSIAKNLRLYYPIVPDLPGVVLRYPDNILNYTFQYNASKQAKKVVAVGAGEGIAQLTSMRQDTSLTQFPLREQITQYKDVQLQPTLDAHADADLNTTRLPLATPTLTCAVNTTDIYPGVIRVGANIQVVINDGWVQVNGLFRVIQWDNHIDDDGTETMVIRMNDAEVLV